jgi:hypothetical protein
MPCNPCVRIAYSKAVTQFDPYAIFGMEAMLEFRNRDIQPAARDHQLDKLADELIEIWRAKSENIVPEDIPTID